MIQFSTRLHALYPKNTHHRNYETITEYLPDIPRIKFWGYWLRWSESEHILGVKRQKNDNGFWISTESGEYRPFRDVQPTRCDVSQFIYYCKTLYMFQTVFPSIIRSSKLNKQRQVFVWPIPDVVCAVFSSCWWRKNLLKHVERLKEINKLRKVTSCWLYSANILAMHGPMNVKYKPASLE